MNLGAFSIRLAVKDLPASKAFYEKFGFRVFAGDAANRAEATGSGRHRQRQ